MVIKIATASIYKMIGYKNGALLLVNSGLSAVITLSFYFSKLLEGTNVKNLVLPIVIYLFGFAVFHLLAIIDLVTGLMNAKYQNSISPNPSKNYIQNYRLWFTIWKNLGVCIFNFILMGLCFLAEIVKGDPADGGVMDYLGAGLYTTFIWFLVTGWCMSAAFEFRSIGQNIERRTGSKAAYFVLVDGLIEIAQKKIIFKAKNSFQSIEPDEETLKDIDNHEDVKVSENEKIS